MKKSGQALFLMLFMMAGTRCSVATDAVGSVPETHKRINLDSTQDSSKKTHPQNKKQPGWCSHSTQYVHEKDAPMQERCKVAPHWQKNLSKFGIAGFLAGLGYASFPQSSWNPQTWHPIYQAVGTGLCVLVAAAAAVGCCKKPQKKAKKPQKAEEEQRMLMEKEGEEARQIEDFSEELTSEKLQDDVDENDKKQMQAAVQEQEVIYRMLDQKLVEYKTDLECAYTNACAAKEQLILERTNGSSNLYNNEKYYLNINHIKSSLESTYTSLASTIKKIKKSIKPIDDANTWGLDHDQFENFKNNIKLQEYEFNKIEKKRHANELEYNLLDCMDKMICYRDGLHKNLAEKLGLMESKECFSDINVVINSYLSDIKLIDAQYKKYRYKLENIEGTDKETMNYIDELHAQLQPYILQKNTENEELDQEIKKIEKAIKKTEEIDQSQKNNQTMA